MNDNNWVPLTSSPAEVMATGDLDGNGKDDVVIGFGPGLGTCDRVRFAMAWIGWQSIAPRGGNVFSTRREESL